jgi:hypothetical protein
MPCRRKPATPAADNGTVADSRPPRQEPALIRAAAYAELAVWGRYLGLPRSCLPREARLGRIVVSRRAGRLWASGAAIRDWLEGGRVKRRQHGRLHDDTTDTARRPDDAGDGRGPRGDQEKEG